jgi:hypothetical protein
MTKSAQKKTKQEAAKPEKLQLSTRRYDALKLSAHA